MSRLLQAVIALALSFFALFLLWYFPDYVGALASSAVMLISILIYYLSQRGEQAPQ